MKDTISAFTSSEYDVKIKQIIPFYEALKKWKAFQIESGKSIPESESEVRL